jgi:hypothetical protein
MILLLGTLLPMGDLLYIQRTMCNGDINLVPLRVNLLYLEDQQQILCGIMPGNWKCLAKSKSLFGGFFMVILPLKSNLCNRHIGTSGECPICRLHAEDILHLLFNCDPAKNIWECLGLSSIIANALLADRSGSAILEHILCLPDNTPSGFEVVQLYTHHWNEISRSFRTLPIQKRL